MNILVVNGKEIRWTYIEEILQKYIRLVFGYSVDALGKAFVYVY